jgi:NhaP-type Na+/H+ or K+/H+ antiporter
VEIGFPEALLSVGLLLLVAASLSGLMHGTVLSISVLSVAAGIVLAEAGVVSVDAADVTVVHLVELALVLTLFADGLLVDRELLWLHWSAPVRAIAIAMPITLVLLAGAALVLLGGGVPARRRADANRSGRHLLGGERPRGARSCAPHAEP